MRKPLDNEAADQESRLYNAAIGFYAVNAGRMECLNRHTPPAAHCEQERNPPPPQSSFEQMQLATPREESQLSDQIEPRIVAVEPGPDTEATRNCDPRQAEYDQLQDSEARITKQNTIGDKQKAISRADERWDYSSASDTEVADGNSRTGILNEIRRMAVKSFRDMYKSGLEQQLSKQESTISTLEKKNKRRKHIIEQLKRHVSVLQDHSTQLEEKYRDATALLQKANASAAELKDDIARLINAVPERTKDDQYFNTKFGTVFYSLEGWVLRYFKTSKLDSSTLPSLPVELKNGLYEFLGEEWATFAGQETLRTIEAVVVRVVQNMIFEPRVLGIVGDSFPEIEQHFGSCTVDAINTWRMQTSQMIISSPGFPAMVEVRVAATADYIEHLLGPLAGGMSENVRIRRLRTIIQQAADLALECSKEPSTFTYKSYGPGWACQSNCMTDALRTVDDEHIGEDEACVRLVVSPAVMRTPDNPNDEPIIIMKARVVRQIRPSAEREECESTGNSKCDVITATQLDIAFGGT